MWNILIFADEKMANYEKGKQENKRINEKIYIFARYSISMQKYLSLRIMFSQLYQVMNGIRLISFLISFFQLLSVQAQQVEFSFPQANTLNVYYFQGNRTDSLHVDLDKNGYASQPLPEGYKGLIRLDFAKQGLIECIAGEPSFSISCNDYYMGRDNIKITGSKENDFLYDMFSRKTAMRQRLVWLQQGLSLYGQDEEINSILIEKKEKEGNELLLLGKEIESSSLYASSLLQIIDFSNELIAAVETGNSTDMEYLRGFLQNRMNWTVLYTSGDFWKLTLQYFFALSAGQNLPQPEKEHVFANTFMPVLQQQEEPVRSALFLDLITNCERFGFDFVKDTLVSFIAANNIPIQTNSEKMRQLLVSANVRPGKKAPDIEGITMLDNQQPILLVFYESGCDNCIKELEEVVKYYSVLQNKGMRVITVSADVDDEIFRYFSESMPWNDKLCDFAGFNGTNFMRYGIIGTPVFYLINKDGIIINRSAKFLDLHIVE